MVECVYFCLLKNMLCLFSFLLATFVLLEEKHLSKVDKVLSHRVVEKVDRQSDRGSSIYS